MDKKTKIQVRDLNLWYGENHALKNVNMDIKEKSITAFIGPSGCGKSTFLNMIGGLDRPSAGKLYVDGKDLFKLNEAEYVKYKQETVGFVWQNNGRNMLPFLPVLENIMLPMNIN